MTTRLAVADGVHDDVARIAAHPQAYEIKDTELRVNEIFDVLLLLKRHPLIGRPVGDGLRELVSGRDARGYVARYRYDTVADLIDVVALRAQREAGFGD